MSKTWRCGDCGCTWDKSVYYCPHKLDDYLSLRGGSIESAIQQAVDRAIEPLVARALTNLNRVPGRVYWSESSVVWKWGTW